MHNPHTDFTSRALPLDELELYEVLTAAFPDRFNSTDEDDNWDQVMDFAHNLARKMDVDELCALLGRIVLLTLPMKTALLGNTVHALGSLEYAGDGSFIMTAGVQRPALEVSNAE